MHEILHLHLQKTPCRHYLKPNGRSAMFNSSPHSSRFAHVVFWQTYPTASTRLTSSFHWPILTPLPWEVIKSLGFHWMAWLWWCSKCKWFAIKLGSTVRYCSKLTHAETTLMTFRMHYCEYCDYQWFTLKQEVDVTPLYICTKLCRFHTSLLTIVAWPSGNRFSAFLCKLSKLSKI